MNIFSSSRRNLIYCIRNKNYGLFVRYLKYDLNLMSQAFYAIPFGVGDWIYGMVIKFRLKRDKKLHPTNCDFVCGVYDMDKVGVVKSKDENALDLRNLHIGTVFLFD
jgi:hypothetical protein